MSDKRLFVNYDETQDVLQVTVGDAADEQGIIVEAEENLFLKLSVESGEIIGYTITAYSENVHKNRKWTDKLLTVPDEVRSGCFYRRGGTRRPRRAA